MANRGGIEVAFFDPAYQLSINNTPLSGDIERLIRSIEYESTDGLADMLKMELSNPDGMVTDLKLFQPGNEASVAFGYGGSLSHIGRAVLVHHSPRFPQDGMPTIEITGYTKDFLMMDSAPDKGKGKERIFKAPVNVDDVIEKIARRYKFEVDLGPELTTGIAPLKRSIVQKSSMSDYDVVQGLANTTGYVFWVDGTEDGRWVLHFMKPDAKGKVPPPSVGIAQEKQYTFRYNSGDASALLSFEPDHALRDIKTKITVISFNEKKGKPVEFEVTDDALAPDTIASTNPEDEVAESLTSGGSLVTLIFGDEFGIDTIADKKFQTDEELRRWAIQWFRRHRQDFVRGRGKLIGIETLTARQVHVLEGIGRTYGGEYYFSRVRHALTTDSGYEIDFDARKVIG